MNSLPPPLLIEILAQPEVFIAGMVGMLLGLAPSALIEWLDKRREKRELDEATDYLIRQGFLEIERKQWLAIDEPTDWPPEDVQ